MIVYYFLKQMVGIVNKLFRNQMIDFKTLFW
jgi:hypothetical protein